MDNRLDELLRKIKHLEDQLLAEVQRKEKQFEYEVRNRKIHFSRDTRRRHRQWAKSVWRYLTDARFLSMVTAPVIWSCIVPILLADVWVTAYQFICFPAYGIPKVRRRDYVVMDRGRLAYLNSIEKFNCVYCEYVNGVIAYMQEIAGRTEQHWCPIKHALRLKTMHSRYRNFVDYGDAEEYRKRVEEVRRDFEDVKNNRPTVAETPQK
jgi:hypothetical protein